MRLILSQHHNVLHKVKYIHPITDEVFCKCDYHGWDYTEYDNINIEDPTIGRKCKKCFRKINKKK